MAFINIPNIITEQAALQDLNNQKIANQLAQQIQAANLQKIQNEMNDPIAAQSRQVALAIQQANLAQIQSQNTPQIQALKQAQLQNALREQGIFSPTTVQGQPAVQAIPLTYEEQRAMAPFLPGTPEALASQAPVEVPSNLAPQDVRLPNQLGNGFVQAPEILTQNLNEAIRRTAAQKQQDLLMKPMSIDKDKTLIIPRGPSGQAETLYSPPENQADAAKLDATKLKQLNTIQDNLNQVPAYKNYTNIQEEQARMDAALKVGRATGNYFGADLALADQFIRGIQGNYAIRQGTQKILLSEQPLVNRLLGTMTALVSGSGGQGFTDKDREQLLKLSKALRDTSLEELKPKIQTAFDQLDELKIPRKFLFGNDIMQSDSTEEAISKLPTAPKIYNSPQDIEAAGQRGEIQPGEVIFDKSVGKKAVWNP